MALEKIRPRVVDATGNYTFNDVNLTGNISAPTANISNLTGVTNLVASSTIITVTGNVSTTSNVAAGNIKTDNLLYANGVAWSFGGGAGATVAGANTQIQFNDGGSAFGASANLTFDKTSNTLTVAKISANGAGLTSLTGANVTGTVANATYAVSAGTAGSATTAGTVTTAAQGNITSVGTLTSLGVTGNITSGNANLGNLTSSNYFSGNGSLLSSITGGNVTGAVAYATTANAVAGANVSGQVSYAATANAVAGSNVMGAVGLATYATTANAVAGSNVSGAVAYATTANAVAGSNVSGAVAYATTANSVAGSNVSGQVANALIAGTVTTNAQPNITSVGTLTGLSVTGDTTLTGNLTVSGAFEYANVTSFRVKDPIIEQGGNTAGGALGSNDGYDRGQLLHYYTGSTATDAFMGWDNSNAEFAFGSNVSVTSEVVTFNSLGNVRANFFIGNGSQLTGVDSAGKVANGNSNVNITTANGNITMGVAGNAGIITVTGTGVNISGYANLGSGNLITTGNVSGNFILGNGYYLTGVDQLTVGNADGANFIANGTSNVNTPIANGNITVGIGGVSNTVVFTTTGVNIAGYVNATGNLTAGNITTSGSGGNISGANNISANTFTATGNISAGSNYFLGNGYYLTGIDAAGRLANGNSNVNIPTANGNITMGVSGNAGIVTVTGTGVNIAGTLNIGTGNLTTGNANLGNLVSANYFSGNGSLLTAITGGNVTGAVAYATTANAVAGANVSGQVSYAATANAVAGSNVSGAVAYATTANAVAGSNVSGAVAYATTANAVAGSNVSGAVAYATTANAVAGANVSGTVANATYAVTAGTAYSVSAGNITGTVNLANYATTANAVAGANVSGAVAYATTANAVAGANVSGAVAYATTANAVAGANVSGNVATATSAYKTANGTSNVNIAAADGNIIMGVAGNAGIITVTGTGVNIAGYGNITGNVVVGNISATNLGNISSKNIDGNSSNVLYGNGIFAPISVSSGSQLVNGTSNVAVALDGNVTAGVAGTASVVTITSTGVNIAGYANLGSGNLLTTGNASAAYFIGNGSSLGSITGANVSGAVAYATTANAVAGANVSGQVANALIAGTVYTNAQPNITSVGTLANLTVGNATANTVFGNGTINATGNANVGNLGVTTDLIVGGNLTVSGTTTTVNSTTTRVVDPIVEQGGGANGAALSSNDSKDRGQLLHYYTGSTARDAFMGWDNSNAEFAFGSNVSVASEVVTFNSLGNVRANFFIGNGSQLTGIDLLTVSGADQANYISNGTSNVNTPVANGNITVSVAGVGNTVVFTSTGVNVAGTLTTTGNINVGSNYFVGNGSYLTGISATTAVSLVNGNSNVVVSPNSNVTISVTSASNVVTVTSTGVNIAGYANLGSGNLITTGNATAGFFIGNGSQLTGLDAAGRVVNGTSNLSIATVNGNISFGVGGTGNVAIVTTTGIVITGSGTLYANSGTIGASVLTGTLSTAAQNNITSVGTLSSLVVTANANVGNINTGGNVYANSGIVKGQYLYGDGSNLTGLGGAGYIFNGTSNVYIPSSGSNVYFTVGLTANIVTVTSTGVNIAGYANLGSGALTTTGNITAGNANLGNLATANYFSGNLYGNANTAGTVTASAQPNITSLGTLANLTVAGPANLGAVGNVIITGGSANYYLKTDGTGNLTWSAVSGGGGGGGTSLTYTADTTPPGTGNILGDQWYNTTSNVLYEYISDGSASYWVDISGATTTTTTPTTLNLANVLISGGTSGQALVSNGSGGLSFTTLTSNIFNGNSNVIVSASSNVTFSIAGIANVLTITNSSANLISTGSANLGNLVTANYFTGTLTTASQPNITTVGTLANLTVSGLTTYGLSADILVTKTGATGTVTHDVSAGAVFYHTSPSANFTANFTNVSTTTDRVLTVTLLISQGATPYMCTAVQIDSFVQTVKWIGGVTATGSASKLDIVSFSLLRTGGSWIVTGQSAYYG